MAENIEQWWQAGEITSVELSGTERGIFVRRMGAGEHMTLLHGYPSSSHDWAKVAPALGADRELLMPDLLGFGASDKPVDHTYSLHEQADLVEALWARHGVRSTHLVAHDYSATIAQELLARNAEGRLSVELRQVHLLNGGVYPDLHRPEPVQTALLDPEQGPQISAALTEELLVAAVAPTYGEAYDGSADSAEMWRAISRGPVLMHRLISYMTDRRTHADRWVGALETTEVPLAFVWGMQDPVSGAHMAERIRERRPDAPFTALDDVGHWPPLEAPDRVVSAVLGR
jgi:pimeloyl-ACP methyl ester carboxylesterase